MFWAKSCELTNMVVPDSKEMSDPRGFELEFGQWCMRATLDIIGCVAFELPLTPFLIANKSTDTLVLEGTSTPCRTPRMSLSTSTVRS